MNVRSGDKKQAILEATMELIAENGLHATPMSQVIKRSGVSAGTIYHYFPSKEAIINELYLNLKREIIEAAFSGYDNSNPYEERFFLIWRNYFNYLVSNPRQLSFTEQCSTSPLISAEAREEGYRYLSPMIEFTEDGIESGHLKDMEIKLISFLLYGSIVSTAKLHLSGALEITEGLREAAARSCWDGLKAV